MPQLRIKFKNLPEINRNIVKHIKEVEEVSRQIMDRNFIEGVGRAKEGAPWTDRTGNARNSINYSDESQGQILAFWLYIGVEYGIWLEIANGGKYRILVPTFDIVQAKVKEDLRKVGINMKAVR